MHANNLKPAIGYIRFSSVKQTGGHSIEIQQNTILHSAEMQGYCIKKWCKDEAVSAYRNRAERRPGIIELYNSILNGEEEAVFFYDSSRVSRLFDDFALEVYYPILKEKPNCKFFEASQNEEWNPSNLLTQVKLLYSYEEVLTKSKRAKDAQKTLLYSTGKPIRPGSRVPFGYNKVQDTFFPNEEAAIVYFIFHLASWGYGNKKIADVLNSAQVPSSNNGEWQASSVDFILNNRFYAGDLTWNVRIDYNCSKRKPYGQYDLFENNHPPIIPAYLWDLVHNIRQHKKNSGKMNTPFFLRNIVHCKSCLLELTPKDASPTNSKKKYTYYYCNSCNQKISSDMLHDIVLKRLSVELEGMFDKMKSQVIKRLSDSEKSLAKQKESFKAQQEIISYKERMIENMDQHEEWKQILSDSKEIITEKLTEISLLIEKIKQIKNENLIADAFLHFKEVPSQLLTYVELRTLCLALINKIDISLSQTPRVSIDYRFSPFFILENQIGQITEMPLN
ncbi:recombinase family protein [Aneurinibacillus danicus]|uniref:Resolvase/invertase-type recombinase catalytic domain-containing protein n=1 Tax=Aneurinibacillus danicus TaxID=267746 RepID=A0A511VF94_9BACL|nr:recombinase family protein [Aneurinibacillus danicus]GEN36628.1 hypothetical protein ADA01nite_40880 [Aneurinibacillus danicus]